MSSSLGAAHGSVVGWGTMLQARGSVVGWGTMLQVGRSRFGFPLRSLDFSIDLILPAALLVLGSIQLLREMSKADNLTAICELIV
jgi:hypothetical protein